MKMEYSIFNSNFDPRDHVYPIDRTCELPEPKPVSLTDILNNFNRAVHWIPGATVTAAGLYGIIDTFTYNSDGIAAVALFTFGGVVVAGLALISKLDEHYQKTEAFDPVDHIYPINRE